MSEPAYVYAVPFALVRAARHGGDSAAHARDAVRAAKLASFPSLEHFFAGQDLGDPAETISVLEVLARALGRRLPSTLGGGFRLDALAPIDRALAAAGLAPELRFEKLLFAGSFVPGLAMPEEKPTVGYVEPEAVLAAARLFADEPVTCEDDPSADAILSEMDDWLTLVQRWQPEFAAPLGLFGIYG